MVIAITWIGLCFLVSFAGSNKNLGYWGTFIMSLFFSPLVGLIAALISSTPTKEYKCKHCGFKSKLQSHFCPACDKDDQGKTKEDYKKQI